MIDQQIQLAHDLAERGEPDEALRIASHILNESPKEARALFLASYVFLQAERFGLAYNLLKQASTIVPFREQVWNNLGMCCMKMGFIDEARTHLNKALKLNKDNYPAMNNLALIEVNECNPIKALEYVNKSLSINADQWDVLETKGYASLMLGKWADGWDGYEAMVGNTKQRTCEPRANVPYWDGSDVDTLLIRGEQGIGDEISFSRLINDVTCNVVLECDRRLEGLFKRSFPSIKVQGTRFDKVAQWPAVDAYCLIGSLAWHYREKESDFTGEPYLKADSQRKLQWRALLDSLGNKPKIGIAWNGGLKDTFTDRRSLDLEALLPILKQDYTFIILEYKAPDVGAFEAKHGIKIHHFKHATQTNDYDDTAALVDELDLVISVQTAIVHLCAGLGKECWALISNKPNWRYATKRYMWGDSVTMYKQKKTWAEPINTIAQDLKARYGD